MGISNFSSFLDSAVFFQKCSWQRIGRSPSLGTARAVGSEVSWERGTASRRRWWCSFGVLVVLLLGWEGHVPALRCAEQVAEQFTLSKRSGRCFPMCLFGAGQGKGGKRVKNPSSTKIFNFGRGGKSSGLQTQPMARK